jgi:hypothetical protein
MLSQAGGSKKQEKNVKKDFFHRIELTTGL